MEKQEIYWTSFKKLFGCVYVIDSGKSGEELKMKPGSELDALIAEKVMGNPSREHKWTECDDPWYNQCLTCGALSRTLKDNGECIDKPYSTDIRAAWEVVEKMQPKCFRITVFKQEEGSPVIQVVNNEGPYLSSEVFPWECKSVPHAICLAALKASGVEYE